MGSPQGSGSPTARYLPQVLIATAAVMVIPLAVVSVLRSAGVISSPWVCVPLAVAVSLAVSAAGSAYWKRRRPAPELLFSELMVWGWFRRVRSERALRNATVLLEGSGELSGEQGERRLRQLTTALEALDVYTLGHSRRVASHSAAVARKLGLTAEQTRRVRAAAALHDVGKLHVAPEVLAKPERLSDQEYELVKGHASSGARLVSAIGDEQLTEIVRDHHERLDGSGYPSGIGGEEIPLGARIIAVADTFDAITSTRPYRPARPHKQALEILREESGRQLDGRVVDVFISCYAGKRAVAAWAMLSSLPQTALAALSRAPRHTAHTRISPRASASSATTMAVIAGIALASSLPADHHIRRHTPPPTGAYTAAPILHPAVVRVRHRTRKKIPSRAPSASALAVIPARPAARTPPPPRQIHTHATRPRRPRSAAPPPAAPPPAATTTTTPSTTTSTTASATTTPPAATTSTTTSTATVPTATTTTQTTTSTPTTNGDPCKNGGWVALGYTNQGQCVSAEHGHHSHRQLRSRAGGVSRN